MVLVRAPEGVGIEDRLAERTGAAVGGRRDRESTARDVELDLGRDRRGTVRVGVQVQREAALESGRRDERQSVQRRVQRGERAAVRDNDPVPSPEPVRPAVVESVSVPAATESVKSQVGFNGPSYGPCREMPSPEAADKVSG